jgi:hypothetical protein
MLLLNKYSRQTENTYCKLRAEQNIDFIIKVFMLKFNKDAVFDAYVKGDPIVDEPGSRLNDFLDNEFKNNDIGAEEMEAVQEKYKTLMKKRQGSAKIHTTLYELMETVIDVADPEEDKLVNNVTINILKKTKPNVRVSAH